MRRALATAEADGLDLSAPGVWEQILEVAHG
jgi:glutamate synthase (NADPH/NADH) large chain